VSIVQEDSFQKTIFKIIPSSDKEDFVSLSQKIKTLKKLPFHKVFIFMPSMMFFKCSKEMQSNGISLKQLEVKHDFAKLEVDYG
jgi:hypothetical protein